ncbi:uncharacterized protein LOC121367604 [Gigantopelta aegis]|uniref:uncharacterized protein LOC121367604 n=1 Tax=Gigantopelta aegis TaxID=1735272 RepID=UPI001B88AE8C|nr:uncharacterized protein LOC121367604 [Gigantopelta aegis]
MLNNNKTSKVLSENGSMVLSINRSTVLVNKTELQDDARVPPDNRTVHRKRRYNYEDTYEWEKDDKLLEYDVDEDSIQQKIGRHWKKVAAVLVFVFAGLILACIIGRLACTICWPQIKAACFLTYCPLLDFIKTQYDIICRDDSDKRCLATLSTTAAMTDPEPGRPHNHAPVDTEISYTSVATSCVTKLRTHWISHHRSLLKSQPSSDQMCRHAYHSRRTLLYAPFFKRMQLATPRRSAITRVGFASRGDSNPCARTVSMVPSPFLSFCMESDTTFALPSAYDLNYSKKFIYENKIVNKV